MRHALSKRNPARTQDTGAGAGFTRTSSRSGVAAAGLLIGLLTGGQALAQVPALLADPAVARQVQLPDFSYAGYGFGLKPLPASPANVIDVTAHGAVPNDTLDDSKAVLAAIAAANKVSGPVTLRFPAGRFVLSEVLEISRSAMVVEGAGRGPGGTELHFPRPLRLIDRSDRLDELRRYLLRENKRQVERKRNIDLPFSAYSWSGGVVWIQAPKSRPAVYLDDVPEPEPAAFRLVAGEAFGSSVQLGQPGSFRAGDIVRIRWTSPDGPESGLITSLYGKGMKDVGSRHFESPERAIVIQTTRIASVSGNRLTLADPLLHAIGPKMPATLVRWQGLTDVGIRDLAITFPAGSSFGHHLEEGYNAIAVNDLFDGFVASVRVAESDSAILTYNSASLTIRDILTEGKRPAHYAVHMGNVHNVLATGLEIRNPVLHSLSFNTQSTRSVFQHASVWQDSVLDQHAGANHQNLFDAVRLHIVAKPGKGGPGKEGPSYPLWDGSGAAYWQPGHGRFNTHWNLQVIVESGALPGETVLLTGLEEGPDARIVGVWGNRRFAIDYRPMPYVEALNQPMGAVPSLYDWQLQRRRR